MSGFRRLELGFFGIVCMFLFRAPLRLRLLWSVYG